LHCLFEFALTVFHDPRDSPSRPRNLCSKPRSPRPLMLPCISTNLKHSGVFSSFQLPHCFFLFARDLQSPRMRRKQSGVSRGHYSAEQTVLPLPYGDPPPQLSVPTARFDLSNTSLTGSPRNRPLCKNCPESNDVHIFRLPTRR